MAKRFFLLLAMFGLMGLGMASAMGGRPAEQPEWGTCKWYCGSQPYNTRAQCGAACGGTDSCEQIC